MAASLETVLDAIQRNADVSARLLIAAESIRQAQESPATGGVHQIVMQPPDSGERAVHRVEKYFVAMVVLNICMGGALVLNWITDTNQSYVINAIYMMAPGLQREIETKKEAVKP
jgi:hypothetical protein